MVYTDETASFKTLIAQGAKPSTSTYPPRTPPQRHDDGFLAEAYQIVRHLPSPRSPQYGHLADLGRMLKAVRKPYLSTAEPPPLSRRARATADDDTLKRYEGSKFLSERERDEIEVRAKMILRRCRDRVGMLEDAEKGASLSSSAA